MAAGPDLRTTQDLFWSLITAPEGVRPGLEELERRGQASASILDELFTGDDRLPAADRLDIYANMYFFRLLDCLREDYPKVATAVGDDRFHNLATDYLLRHPSENPSLRELGRRLPRFIATHALAAEFPYLADLARLEWARAEVFDAPDAAALRREDLARLPEDRAGEARLALVPACELLRFDYNVARIWRDLEEGDPDPASARPREGNSASPDVEAEAGHHDSCAHAAAPRGPRACRPKKTAARVWRHDAAIYHRSVDEEEACCLDMVREGEPLGRICQRLAAGRSPARATERVGRMIQSFIEDGI